MKTKRTVAKQQFTRTENSLRQALTNLDSLESTIEQKYGELRVKWQVVQDTHDLYITMLPADESQKEDSWIDELVERFDAIEADADQVLVKFHEKNPMVEETDEKKEDTVEPKLLQLERLKLDKFNGDVRKYPTFRETFQLYVEPMVPKSQLPLMLRGSLEESVKQEVENIADDMTLLWKRLDEKYGSHSKYVDIILSDLTKTTKGDSKAALHLINTVERAHRDLERIGAAQEMSNSTIIAMIERKLPDEMRFDWIQTIAPLVERSSTHKFQLLLQFLKKWKQMIEYDEAAIRKVPEKKAGATYFASSRRNKKSESCWIHTDNGEHPIWRCRIFQSMSLQEKLDLVKQKEACQACLEVSCEGATKPENCKRGFRCQIEGCDKFHNVLLHE